MARLIATRISDEQYSKIMGKCAGLGCSVYDYLKMLVETDITETKETTRADQKQTRYGPGDQERARRIRELLRQAEERQAVQAANGSSRMCE